MPVKVEHQVAEARKKRRDVRVIPVVSIYLIELGGIDFHSGGECQHALGAQVGEVQAKDLKLYEAVCEAV